MESRAISPEERAVLARLHTAQGHLRATITMLETGQPGEQVLHQLGAIQAALRAAGCALLRLQLKHCLMAILHSPCEEARQAEIEKCLALFRQKRRFYDQFNA